MSFKVIPERRVTFTSLVLVHVSRFLVHLVFHTHLFNSDLADES